MTSLSSSAAITCFGQVNQGRWCQEHYETASRDAARRTKELRHAGYAVTVCSLGTQVTNVGYVKMTMVDVRPGTHEDTTDLPAVRIVRG